MIGTVIAIIIALGIHFTHIGEATSPNLPMLGWILIAVATLFLFLSTIAYALAWSPLQRAEQDLTPRVTDQFRKDGFLKFLGLVLLIFPLITFLIAIDILFLNILNNNIVLPIWIVLFGVSLDALYSLLKTLASYMDPFYIVTVFSNEAQKCIRKDQDAELCNWIDALAEVAIKSIQRTSLSLCNDSCNQLQRIARVYLESAKGIGHLIEDAEDKAKGVGDRVGYIMFFVLQRLEMINDKAAEQRLEPVCSNLQSILGKIVIDSAKFDISVPTYPLNYFGRFAVTSLKHGLKEVGTKSILILLEVAKSILNEIDITYLELQDPFNSLIAQMHAITEEIFKQDKSINVKLLIQPFQELKALFTNNEKAAKHQDAPAIIENIDRVLAEYTALETVLRTLPPMPTIVPEEST